MYMLYDTHALQNYYVQSLNLGLLPLLVTFHTEPTGSFLLMVEYTLRSK